MKVCKHCGAVRDTWPLSVNQAIVMQYLSKGYRPGQIAKLLKLKHASAVYQRIWRVVEALKVSTSAQAIATLAERGYFKE